MKNIKHLIQPSPNTDSPIEEILYQEFKIYNVVPIPQYHVGKFYIDLAFPEIKLAIEADGDEFHSTAGQITSDISREIKLEKMGWKILRFTGSEIYKNYEVIVAKSLLQNFEDKISEDLRNRAIGRIVNYFTKKDYRFAGELTEAAIKGYIYKK